MTDGVFQDMEEAIGAATAAQRTLVSLSLAVREELIEAIRRAGRANGSEYARMEWEETGLGKVEDNLKKWTGDHIVDPSFVSGILFADQAIRIDDAGLINVAPTVLECLGLEKPEAMSGETLL